MGRGNLLPQEHNDIDYRMVYVEYDNVHTSFRELENTLLAISPKSFYKVFDWIGQGEFVVCKNGLLEIRIADEDCYTAVIVRPRWDVIEYYPSDLNLAYHHLDGVADKLFRKLCEDGYKLNVRTGAWTSSEYQY